jgi:hypothetical protein
LAYFSEQTYSKHGRRGCACCAIISGAARLAATSGKSAKVARMSEKTAFGTLIDLHIDDMKEAGKAPRRSKQKSLEKLKGDLSGVMLHDLDRERLIAFGKSRGKEGRGQ